MAASKFRVATLNVNGIRSGLAKGLAAWLKKNQPDVLCLQEIKTQPKDLDKWSAELEGWHCYWQPAAKPGYAGVGVICKAKPAKVTAKFGDKLFDGEGRWLEVDCKLGKVVSLYLPSGTTGSVRQKVKYQAMDMLYKRLAKLRKAGKPVIVAGDYNIAHTKDDIKNWQSNQKNSGFLPEERAWFTEVLDKLGWVDVFRSLVSKTDAYSWWSLRSGARKRNVGWRIDYQLADPKLAKKAAKAWIDAGPVLSDHAPVVVDYKL